MKVRKAIKKLIALGTGAILVGATVLGAMAAADLKDYPKPFAKDGKFDGLIVVGEAAAAMDVVGAVDIATSMQYAVKQTQTINVGSASGSVMMTGDYAQFGGASDMLELGEDIGDVQETMTEKDIMLLKGGVVSTDSGTTDYNQYLRFTNSVGVVTYDQNDDDEVADYLYFASLGEAFEYELQFEEGLKSDYEAADDTLPDLEDEAIVILGKTYSIVETDFDGVSDITLTLLGGDVTDTLYEGETKTYTVAGKDYEVEALIVSDTAETVKLKVNGEVTKQLADGDTERMSDGTEIGIREIMPNEGTEEGGGDLVEFYIGANKLVLSDSDITDAVAENQFEVNDETVEDIDLTVQGTVVGTDVSITSVKFALNVDTEDGAAYIKEGMGLREQLREPEGMISPDWDIVYMGLEDTGSTVIKFKSDGDDAYKLEFETREGLNYNIPLITTDGAFQWGNEDYMLNFVEAAAGSFEIDRREYFIVTSSPAASIYAGSDSAYTHVLRFDSVDTSSSILTFSDLASGQLEATYNAGTGVGTLVVGGTTYDFDFDLTSALDVDMDNSGAFTAGNSALIVTEGGYVIDLGLFDEDEIDGNANTAIQMTTLAKRFDAGYYDSVNVDEDVTVTITDNTDSIDINAVADDSDLDMQSVEGMDLKRGMTKFGALYELTDSSSADDADELTITYPLSQRAALVYVVAGETSSSKTSAAKGTVETVSLEKINVGAAKLDSEVSNVWGQNLILVGGPCANKAALEVMGVTADTCAEGFEEGKAMIKLYEKSGKVAMVVAGYSAMDTRRATRVIADYSKYKSDLMGMEVEVSGTTLTDITVSKAQ